MPIDLEERRETFNKDPQWGWTTDQKRGLPGECWWEGTEQEVQRWGAAAGESGKLGQRTRDT